MSDTEPTEPIKLFISHASEDKDDFVRPLAEALVEAGFDVWYDEFSLTLGDSLRKRIDEGLGECDFGVVVFSPHFFEKDWPENELNGLFALESKNRKVILPIWKDVSRQEVQKFSLMLADRVGVPASKGIEAVVGEIERAVQTSTRTEKVKSGYDPISDFANLSKEIVGSHESHNLENSREGVALVLKSAQALIAAVHAKVEKMEKSPDPPQVKLDKADPIQVSFVGSFGLRFVLRYDNRVVNSIREAVLRLLIYQHLDPFGEDFSKRRNFARKDFVPKIHHEDGVYWHLKGEDTEFANDKIIESVLREIVAAFRVLHEEDIKRREQ